MPTAPELERGSPGTRGDILVVVPCGRRKIWDREPETGPVCARDAYVGAAFHWNRLYAETFASAWVILSAKYGFLRPDDQIVGPYNVTFGTRETEAIDSQTLRQQVAYQGLHRYGAVVALGGKRYREHIHDAFAGDGARILAPFAGLAIGKYLQAVRRSIESRESMLDSPSPSTHAADVGSGIAESHGAEAPSR